MRAANRTVAGGALSPSPRSLLLVVSLLLGRRAELRAQSAAATIGVRLHVLPVASFEGGATHRIATVLRPGEARTIAADDGVRTRMRYNAPTRVVVRGTALRGPEGVVVPLRIVCARGDSESPVADHAFDCDAGFDATMPEGRAATVALAVGGMVEADATRGIPGGLYVAQVTFVATTPAY